jgi:serine/threonine-protein kinase
VKVCPECRSTFDEEIPNCPFDGTSLVDMALDVTARMVERETLQRLQSVQAPNNKYTIMERIGQGGWGGVYKAYQHSTQREVALKVLRRDVAEEVQARRRFHLEAQAISRLKHPNTVTIFDFGETEDGLLYIAMEYIQGETLDSLLGRVSSLPPLRAVRIARQVALSLSEAHTKGIIHRDIKPQNIMLLDLGDASDFVKVLDFGVAKLIESDSKLTATGSTFGTPEYMSPEQVQSKPLDHRSDLYSLGVVLYEMLSGRPPFTGDSAVTVAMQHVRARPAPLPLKEACPAALLQMLKRLLAKSMADRPSSAREVAEELERLETAISSGTFKKAAELPQILMKAAVSVGNNWVSLLTVAAVVCALLAALVVVKGTYLGANGASTSGPAGHAETLVRPEEPSNPDGRGRAALPQEENPGPGPLRPPPNMVALTGDHPAGLGQPSAGVLDVPASTPALPASTASLSGRRLPVQSTMFDCRSSRSCLDSLDQAGGSRGNPSSPAQSRSGQAGTGTGEGTSASGVASHAEALVRPEEPSNPEGGVRAALPPEENSGTGEGASKSGETVPRVAVTLTTTPPGFEVWEGKRMLCRTPCPINGVRGELRRFRVTGARFKPALVDLRFERDGRREVPLEPLQLSEADGLKEGAQLSKDDGLK